MESFRDSNANEVSMSDSFSLYERYLRSFNVVDTFVDNRDLGPTTHCDYENSLEGNADFGINKHYEITERTCFPHQLKDVVDKVSSILDTDCGKIEDTNISSLAASSLDNSSATNTTTEHSLLTEKSDNTDVPISSEDFRPHCFKPPVFITSTMENSNNAVDSVPLFRDTRPNESVFKLPTRELSFNGTLKHVQKLKPIVDPITAMTSTGLDLEEKSLDQIDDNNPIETTDSSNSNNASDSDQKPSIETSNPSSDINRIEKTNESTGDSQYEECTEKKQQSVAEESNVKWNLEQSYSSLEASFDSGVRSPDMFSEGEEEPASAEEPFWSFLKDYEAHDKRKLRKLEENLQGILPPPSVTTLKIDVTEMLNKYHCFLPAFTDNAKVTPDLNSSTPTKRVSFVQIPTDSEDTTIKSEDIKIQVKSELTESSERPRSELDTESKPELDTSADKTIELKTCTEAEARETSWPEILKCRHYDVYYNLTQYSEKFELLSLRYGERYVGNETDSTVNVHSGGFQSPSSASKRKAMRLKMAAAKSPGRRLSHLARRRQAFCSAATIGEKAHSSQPKMVYIDKNFFPHRKLINSGERKSPRLRRTPAKKSPARTTPGKQPRATTPRTSSTKKKAMRRLLMDPENVTKSQPREIKRALFISPENRKVVPPAPSSSVPNQAMKSRRALFGSPVTAETKSMDGTQSDQFLKRKRDLDDSMDNGRSKIAKSLSFGGDSIGTTSQPHAFNRRASEMFASKNSIELDDTRKKKLLWAVSEALRAHGWRMSSPGFREKASSLARLTARLLALPPHAARLAEPRASASGTMLKLARQYVFAIIQGRSVEDCYHEEALKIASDSAKLTGYISAQQYQQTRTKPATSTFVPFASQSQSQSQSQVKENIDATIKQEPRSCSKNILQDKLVNIDTSSSSSSGVSLLDKVPLFKSNSMPSFEEAAKMRARRQISFDNMDFPKR